MKEIWLSLVGCGFSGMSGVQLTLGSRNEVATGVCLLWIVPPAHAETGKTVLLHLTRLIKYCQTVGVVS